MIRIGLIADTHGLLRPQAVEFLRGSDAIVHAGDIGDPDILRVLAELAPGVAAALLIPTSPVGGTAVLRVAGSVLAVVALGRLVSYGTIIWLRKRGRISYPTLLIGVGPAAKSPGPMLMTSPSCAPGVIPRAADTEAHGGLPSRPQNGPLAPPWATRIVSARAGAPSARVPIATPSVSLSVSRMRRA